jgi:hypothetical protein
MHGEADHEVSPITLEMSLDVLSDVRALSLCCRKRRLSRRSMRDGFRCQSMRPGGLDHSADGSSFLESVFVSHVAFG